MTLKVGDQVQPVATYDFDSFSGPKDLTSIGEVTAILEAEDIALVVWDNGDENDYALEGFEGGPGFYGHFSHETCGVIPLAS